MPVPIDLVNEGARMDFVELLNATVLDNTGAPINAHIFQSNSLVPSGAVGDEQPMNITSRLDDFVGSPSPLPGGNNEFSDPNPFVAQARLVPNNTGGLTLATERPQRNTELDLLESLSPRALDNVTSQTAGDLSTFGLRTDDPFGTPNPDRVRSILRRLVDSV